MPLQNAPGEPRRRAARGLPSLCADRVGYALLHVAGFCGACEVLLLGVGLTGRRCIALALRHEALESRPCELLVRGIRLAGRKRGCGRDKADRQRQGNFLHGFPPSSAFGDREDWGPRGRAILVEVAATEKRIPRVGCAREL